MTAPRVRPQGVTLIGVATILLGGAVALSAVASFIFMTALERTFDPSLWPWMPWMSAWSGMSTALAMIGMMFMLAFAAFALATGVGVMQGREWAWAATLVVMGLVALNGIGSLAERSLDGVLALAVSGFAIWYFFRLDVKRWFARV